MYKMNEKDIKPATKIITLEQLNTDKEAYSCIGCVCGPLCIFVTGGGSGDGVGDECRCGLNGGWGGETGLVGGGVCGF